MTPVRPQLRGGLLQGSGRTRQGTSGATWTVTSPRWPGAGPGMPAEILLTPHWDSPGDPQMPRRRAETPVPPVGCGAGQAASLAPHWCAGAPTSPTHCDPPTPSPVALLTRWRAAPPCSPGDGRPTCQVCGRPPAWRGPRRPRSSCACRRLCACAQGSILRGAACCEREAASGRARRAATPPPRSPARNARGAPLGLTWHRGRCGSGTWGRFAGSRPWPARQQPARQQPARPLPRR